MTKKLFLTLLSIFIFSLSSISFGQDKDSNTSKRISGGVVNGKAVSLPKPAYPVEAREAKISGSVNVQIVIDRAGNVTSAEAISGHPLLQNVAVEAAKLSKFQPTLLEGSPVEVSGVIVYNFQGTSTKEDTNITKSSKPNFVKEIEPLGFALFFASYDSFSSLNIDDFPDMDQTVNEMSEQYDDAPKVTGKFSEKSAAEQRKFKEDFKTFYIQKYNSTAHWQFQMGEVLGEFLGKFAANAKQGKSPFFPESELRIYLTTINNLMLNVPDNFPKPVSIHLTKLGAYSKNNDLGSLEIQKEVFMNIVDFFEVVCPDE